jgi:spoIIIJ-associated protein
MVSKFEEQKDKAVKTLGMMLDYLSLDANVRGEEKNERIALKISSDEPGRIIGKNGQNLENLQYILNLIMYNKDREFPRIILDIDGYSKGRERNFKGERRERGSRRGHNGGISEDALKQQALDAGKEVKRWGESITLPLMNPHDRRIIHMTLKDDAELTTESEGEGTMKKVVISLKKS